MTHDVKKWNKFAVVATVWAAVPVLGFIIITAMALFTELTHIEAPGLIGFLIAWCVESFPVAALSYGAIGTVLAAVAIVYTFVRKPRQKGTWLAALSMVVCLGCVFHFLNQTRLGGSGSIIKKFRAPDGKTIVLLVDDAPGWVDASLSLRAKEPGHWRYIHLADVGEADQNLGNASVRWGSDGQSFTLVWPGHPTVHCARESDGRWRCQNN